MIQERIAAIFLAIAELVLGKERVAKERKRIKALDQKAYAAGYLAGLDAQTNDPDWLETAMRMNKLANSNEFR